MSRVGAAGFVISAHSGNSSFCFMVFFSPGAQVPHAVFLQKPELSCGYLPEYSLCQRRLSWIRLLNPLGSLAEVPPLGNFCFHFAQIREVFWLFLIIF